MARSRPARRIHHSSAALATTQRQAAAVSGGMLPASTRPHDQVAPHSTAISSNCKCTRHSA